MQESVQDNVTRLFPQPVESLPLDGLYLADAVRAAAASSERPFVYANFVVSLDGRIAVPDARKGGLKVPDAIANDRDWRLFQELAVQADIIITTGRYLRDYAAGKAQEILQIDDDPETGDLTTWRQERGLPAMPDLAVVSSSLDFPIPYALRRQKRRVIVVTDERADPARMARIESQLGEVIVAGGTHVMGRAFVEALGAQGYGTIYSAAGPRILHMLLADSVLDRLYLTTVPRVLGGKPFASIVDGPMLEPSVDMPLRSLYYDAAGVDGLGQMFACYESDRARQLQI